MVTAAGVPQPCTQVGLRGLLWAYAVVFAVLLSALQTINA